MKLFESTTGVLSGQKLPVDMGSGPQGFWGHVSLFFRKVRSV